MKPVKVFAPVIVAGSLFASSPLFAQDDHLTENAEYVFRFLQDHGDSLNARDEQFIRQNLDSILRVIDDYPDQPDRRRSPFQFQLDGTTLKVYARDTNQHLYTWNHHDQQTTVGNVLGLLDSAKEFAAIKYENGVVTKLVEQWRDVLDYKVTSEYIGLIDTNGIAEIFSSVEKKKLLNNYKSTVQHYFGRRFVVLLDNEASRNLDVYDTSGAHVVHMEGVTNFTVADRNTLNYVQSGQNRSIDLRQYIDRR